MDEQSVSGSLSGPGQARTSFPEGRGTALCWVGLAARGRLGGARSRGRSIGSAGHSDWLVATPSAKEDQLETDPSPAPLRLSCSRRSVPADSSWPACSFAPPGGLLG